MAYIGKKPEDLIRGNATYNAFTGDGSTTTYDVTNLLPDGGQFDVEVFVDNVRQEAGSSKSYTIGQDGSGDLKRITFNVAPDDGSEIYVINPGRETSLITVADDTITTAKLQDDAVTTAKITDSNVTTAKIAADAITGAKIADDAINSEHITDGSVDNVHLAGSIANAKLANSSITINGTAVSLGGSVTAGTNWQAVTVADGSTTLNAEAGKGYFLDTNTGVIEVFLPASPTRGDTFVFADYSGTFATNRVLINTRGKNIDSTEAAGEFSLTTNNLMVEIVFVDNEKGYLVKENESKSGLSLIEGGDYTPAEYVAATGGTVSTIGDFKFHKFTGDGCFVVSNVGNSKGSETVTALVVAGGGGGFNNGGGGGGAGGLRNIASQPVSTQTYPITVGGGGAKGPSVAAGANSVFSTITSAGGGTGGTPGGGTGGNGGSGGGAGGNGGNAGTGGSGNTPPTTPPQGNDGGSHGPVPNYNAGAGGGGSSQAGQTAPNPGTPGTPGGHGGNGTDVSDDFPAPLGGNPAGFYAGGGGGGGNDDGPGSASNTPTAPGGGGFGSSGPGSTAGAGTANTGGGGGGAPTGGTNANNGGSGIVIVKYKFQN